MMFIYLIMGLRAYLDELKWCVKCQVLYKVILTHWSLGDLNDILGK